GILSSLRTGKLTSDLGAANEAQQLRKLSRAEPSALCVEQRREGEATGKPGARLGSLCALVESDEVDRNISGDAVERNIGLVVLVGEVADISPKKKLLASTASVLVA